MMFIAPVKREIHPLPSGATAANRRESKALVGSEDLPVLNENTFNSTPLRHRHGEAFL